MVAKGANMIYGVYGAPSILVHPWLYICGGRIFGNDKIGIVN